MNYDDLLQKLLDQVPNDLDKREGSLIYNSLSPIIIEFLNLKLLIDNTLDLYLFDTSTGDYLTRISNQFNVERLKPTQAVRKILFTSTIDDNEVLIKKGDKFMLDGIIFSYIERTAKNEGTVKCDLYGEIGNKGSGFCNSLQNIPNLATAKITDVLIYGEEEENDASLRERLKDSLTKNESAGNIQHYMRLAKEFNGVGEVKIKPLWNGGNTVKVVITDSKMNVASAELIKQLQQYLDPNSSGLGEGVCNLGAKVTVDTGVKKAINVKATVKLNKDYETYSGVEEAIKEYLSSIVFKSDTVSYLKIASVILDCNSIQDLVSLQINEGQENISLEDLDIVTLESLNVEVV